jgi:hypothetical protein
MDHTGEHLADHVEQQDRHLIPACAMDADGRTRMQRLKDQEVERKEFQSMQKVREALGV